MRNCKILLSIPALGLALLASPAPMQPQELLVQKALPVALAEKMASQALSKCRADGFHVSVTVLDGAGLLKAVMIDDGAAVYSIDFSRQKAYTSYIYRHPSSQVAKNWETKPPVFKIDGTVGAAGGVPIVTVSGQVIGAVGVAGALGGEKDEACAKFAVDSIADQLNK